MTDSNEKREVNITSSDSELGVEKVTVEIDKQSFDIMRSNAFKSAMNPEEYLRMIITEEFRYMPVGKPVPPAPTEVQPPED